MHAPRSAACFTAEAAPAIRIPAGDSKNIDGAEGYCKPLQLLPGTETACLVSRAVADITVGDIHGQAVQYRTTGLSFPLRNG
jgi:hypothetical protein